LLAFLAANRGFRTLWAINLTSSLVGWALGIALGVHTYLLTGSALWTAVVAATPSVAGMLLGHLSGRTADRRDVLALVRLCLFLRIGTLLLLFAVSQSVLGLVTVVLLQAALQQFYTPSEQVLIGNYVRRADLAEANGLNSFASNATRLIAPALGGFLIAWVGFRWTVIGMSVVMLGSALLSLSLPNRRAPEAALTEERTDHWAPQSYREALRASARVRGLVLLQVSDAVKEGPLSALFPVLMLGVIGATSGQMGLANSAFAVTAIIAGPLVGTTTRRLGYRLPVIAGAGFANALIVALVIWPSWPLALIAFFASGLPFTISWVAGQTWLLLSVPDTFRGRVVGTTNAVYSAVLLVAMLLAGALADKVGARWVIGGAAALAVCALLIIDPLMSRKALDDAVDRGRASGRAPAGLSRETEIGHDDRRRGEMGNDG